MARLRNSQGGFVERICSFCGKNENVVRRLIAGPNDIFICDDCVEVCRKILAEEDHDLSTQFTGDIPVPK
ncbi:MAG: ATP-dependent Clp protease ATP-binding subunit ClpX, partial [Treponema sp.]|nr:ATP-dependent Clp protease ATP-binding subunit ClpX [Treponema sp.]